MHLQESGEMYLETIYILLKTGKSVRSIDVCEEMGYSKPSVSRAVGLLKKGEYINVDNDGFITLTELGKSTAEKVFNRHTIITKLLTKLGVKPDIASEDACKMEHVISDETYTAIKNFIEE